VSGKVVEKADSIFFSSLLPGRLIRKNHPISYL